MNTRYQAGIMSLILKILVLMITKIGRLVKFLMHYIYPDCFAQRCGTTFVPSSGTDQ